MWGLDLGNLIAHLRLDTADFDKNSAYAQSRVKSLANSMETIGRNLTYKVTLPLVTFGALSAKTFGKFQNTMIEAAAVTEGATGKMRAAMDKAAIDLSKKSKFSAVEVAGGFRALGQAGESAESAIAALPVVTDFATAGFINLNQSVLYLETSLNAMRLASKDPIENMKQMEKISNALNYAAITTSADIVDFADAMVNNAAPAFAMYNKTLEEGVAILMAFAKAGKRGEEAGSLAYFALREFSRVGDKNRQVWEDLGLNVYTTSGTLIHTADIVEALTNKLKGMTDQQARATLTVLGFQDRSFRAIMALMGMQDLLREYESNLKNLGITTKQVSDNYLQSFNNQMKMTWHHVQSVMISMGDKLRPVILDIGQKIRSLSEYWFRLNDSTQMFIIKMIALAAATGPILLIFSKMLSTMVYLSLGAKVLGTSLLGIAGSLAIITTQITLVMAEFFALVAVIYIVRAVWNQATGTIKKNLEDMRNYVKRNVEFFAQVWKDFLDWLPGAWSEVLEGIKVAYYDWISRIAGVTSGTMTYFKRLASGIKEAWSANTITEGINDIKRALTEADKMSDQAYLNAEKNTKQNLENLKNIVVDAFKTSAVYIEATSIATTENVEDLIEAVKKQLGDDIPKVMAVLQEALLRAKEEADLTFDDTQVKILEKEIQKLTNQISGLEGSTGLEQPFTEMQRQLEYELETLKLTQQGEKRATDIMNHRAKAIELGIENTKEYNVQLEKYKATLKEIEKLHRMDSLTSWFNDSKDIWTNWVDDATSALDSLSSALTDFISGEEVNWKTFTANILKMFLKSLMDMQVAAAAAALFDQKKGIITNLVTSAVSSIGSLGSSAGDVSLSDSGISSSTMSPGATHMPGYALGEVFDAGKIIPMAMGSLVNSFVTGPTLAPMGNNKSALIGEAGVEAVMPVTRTRGGELGIRTEGMSPKIENKLKIVNVYDKEQMLAAMNTDAGEKMIMNKLRKFGVIR